MSMKLAHTYRAVLKRLHEASYGQPHYVQDLRFLLSLPLVPGSATETNASAASRADVVPPCSYAIPPSRPASECLSVDRDAIFRESRRELRERLNRASAGVSVAQSIVLLRDLLWLKKRLEDITSPATRTQLEDLLEMARGPTDESFIPASFFPPSQAASTTGSASLSAPPAPPPLEAKSCEVDERAAPLSSAGAVGQQYELFVSRRISDGFPLLSAFLGSPAPSAPSSSSAPTTASSNGTNSNISSGGGGPESLAACIARAKETLRASATTSNSRVAVTVTARLFDADFTNKEQGGMGYFATAHRQFLVKFLLAPVYPVDDKGDVEDVGMRYVRVVNSHVARIDLNSLELSEEVGYLHPRDAFELLSERDMAVSPDLDLDDFQAEDVPGASEGAEETSTSRAERGRDVAEGEEASTAATPTSDVLGADGRTFELMFINPSDGPSVLKGLLYYKVGVTPNLSSAPVEVVPFGPIILQS